MKNITRSWLITACVVITACAPLPPVPPKDAAVQQCLVCRHNRDFGCLKVAKSPTTPQAKYKGQTYLFCGEPCCCAFVKKPTKFVPKS